jgi:hypothetical protein
VGRVISPVQEGVEERLLVGSAVILHPALLHPALLPPWIAVWRVKNIFGFDVVFVILFCVVQKYKSLFWI